MFHCDQNKANRRTDIHADYTGQYLTESVKPRSSCSVVYTP